MLLRFLCLLPFIFATTAVSLLRDRGTCYRQYIPPQPGFPNARCRHALGGNPATMRVFIRNAFTCCRRRQASGWGTESDCNPCSSLRGILLPWGEWSQCSKTCGWGEQRRHRVCNKNVCAGVRGRSKTETRACMWKACCPVDGSWSYWSHWSGCSVSCGDGLQYRTRSCSSPSPSCGGKPCRSYPRQMQRCRVGSCASWSSWTTQGSCSVTCGIGTVKRTRNCYSQLRDKCQGESEQHLQCDAGSCAVDGKWCEWGLWSPCTTTCQHASGTQKRSRTCECPSPRKGGSNCDGSDGEVNFCSSHNPCPIDGEWSEWASWTACSSERCSVSPGLRRRTRLCDNPPPLYGGTCKGRADEERSCVNLGGCKVEGHYGKWSMWSPCTLTCGSCGIKLRSRECFHFIRVPDTEIIGIPEFYCDESLTMDTTGCDMGPCPGGDDPCAATGLLPETKTESEEYEYGNEDLGYYEGRGGWWSGEEYEYEDVKEHHDLLSSAEDEINPGILKDILGDGDVPARSAVHIDGHHDKDDDDYYEDEGLVDPFDLAGSGDFRMKGVRMLGLVGPEYAGSGDVGKPGKRVDGCSELENAKGEQASTAKGCCEVLSKGVTGDSNPARLEQCFALHFDLAMPHPDDVTSFFERAPRSRCRYRMNEKLLQTICCLMKDCGDWGKAGLRIQCRACRSEACQSCHSILLSG